MPEFLDVELGAPPAALAALADFYDGLGVELRPRFAAADGDPFYHFALLAPGDRFDALLVWARERVELLPDKESGEPVFAFEAWRARACYFHDPAGNIVELIAHRGVGETGARGAFSGEELVGLSELGLVGDTTAMARALEPLGLRVWAGALAEGDLAFVGDPARTLILCPSGRGWLPTGRPAEPHPVRAVVRGDVEGEVLLEGRHRVTVRPAAA